MCEAVLRTHKHCLLVCTSLLSGKQSCGNVCSAVTDIHHALDTTASLVSNLSPLVPKKVHELVLVYGCVSDSGNSPEEHENGSRQVDLRFI